MRGPPWLPLAATHHPHLADPRGELKRIRGQIVRLSKEIDAEQELREPTDAEAPWQGLMDQAQAQASGRRGRPKRDRTGEYPEEDDKE